MPRYRYTVCEAAQDATLATQVWGAITGAWPGRQTPQATFLELDQLAKWLRSDVSGARPMDAPILLVLPRDKRDWPDDTITALRDLAIPTLALQQVGTGPPMRIEGLNVEPAGADPRHLASVLKALADREPAVADLRRELLILRHTQTSLSGQIAHLHDELSLASAIQRGLIPTLPPSTSMQFGVVYRPAGYVSGDIFGVTALSDRRTGFFLADAVGHGVPAALLTMLIHRSMRFDAGRRRDEGEAGPADLLRRLNSELLNCKSTSQLFATAVCGIIDDQTLEVTLACAGHPSPVCLKPSGEVESIDEGGPLLGVFPDDDYPEARFRLTPGETLLIYSDGLEMAFDDPPREAESPLPNYLQRLLRFPWPDGRERLDMQPAISELQDELDCQSGSLHQPDDITILAIAATPKPTAARRAA